MLSEQVMSALWTVCSVCKVKQTVCVLLLTPWFNRTSSMLVNVQLGDRSVNVQDVSELQEN